MIKQCVHRLVGIEVGIDGAEVCGQRSEVEVEIHIRFTVFDVWCHFCAGDVFGTDKNSSPDSTADCHVFCGLAKGDYGNLEKFFLGGNRCVLVIFRVVFKFAHEVISKLS